MNMFQGVLVTAEWPFGIRLALVRSQPLRCKSHRLLLRSFLGPSSCRFGMKLHGFPQSLPVLLLRTGGVVLRGQGRVGCRWEFRWHGFLMQIPLIFPSVHFLLAPIFPVCLEDCTS